MNCKGVEEGVLQNHRPTDRTSTDKCSTDNRPTDPPKLAKLVKLSAEILSIPHSIAISNSLKYGVFPDNVNIASVIPLDKGKPNKTEISNFRPVSILKTFSK